MANIFPYPLTLQSGMTELTHENMHVSHNKEVL